MFSVLFLHHNRLIHCSTRHQLPLMREAQAVSSWIICLSVMTAVSSFSTLHQLPWQQGMCHQKGKQHKITVWWTCLNSEVKHIDNYNILNCTITSFLLLVPSYHKKLHKMFHPWENTGGQSLYGQKLFSLVLISGSLAYSRHSDSRAWTKNCKRKKNEGFSFCACHVQFNLLPTTWTPGTGFWIP